jgi:hypothetical protein
VAAAGEGRHVKQATPGTSSMSTAAAFHASSATGERRRCSILREFPISLSFLVSFFIRI